MKTGQVLWAGFKTIQCVKRKGISPSIYLPKWWIGKVERDKPLAYMEVYPDRIIIYHPNHLPQKAIQELLNLGISTKILKEEGRG